MNQAQFEAVAAVAQNIGNTLYDATQGDVHALTTATLLIAGQLADRIEDAQGSQEALHYALHIVEGSNVLAQSTQHNYDLDASGAAEPQFEEQSNAPSLEDILATVLNRGGRQG